MATGFSLSSRRVTRIVSMRLDNDASSALLEFRKQSFDRNYGPWRLPNVAPGDNFPLHHGHRPVRFRGVPRANLWFLKCIIDFVPRHATPGDLSFATLASRNGVRFRSR